MSRKLKQDKVLQLIPLGGVNEIGKNMFVIRYNRECVIIDAGLKFPDESMLGIDVVIPDTTYLMEHRDEILGIILTHGHEDHIGALPFLLDELNVPVYGTRLTLGLLEAKLMEHPPELKPRFIEINPAETLTLSDNIKLEFFRTNHSIPDSIGVAVDTPAGLVVHSGDFKFDQTPVDGRVTDYHKLAELGKRGVLAAFIDSTNADRPGYTHSEKEVGDSIDDIFRLSKSRIILATFASNIHRIQQMVDSAVRYDRKIGVVGRSIVNSVNISTELGYLKIPDKVRLELEDINKLPHEKLALITTGSQGEPMSALTRISQSDHRQVGIVPGDTVIIAANPIPGNEKLVGRTVNNLFRQQAEVIYGLVSGVHVSGHGSEEEIKLMLNLLKPKYVIPTHGEYRQQYACLKIARKVGITAQNVFITEPGDLIEFSDGTARLGSPVTAGKVLVDGFGVGDVGEIVIRDRQILSEDGIVVIVMTVNHQAEQVISNPEIVTRGFVYVRESEDLLVGAKDTLSRAVERLNRQKITEWSRIKNAVRESASSFFYDRTGRRPMIMPIVIDVKKTEN